MGYVKAKSTPSLVAGGISGALLLFAGFLMGRDYVQVGVIGGIVVSVALAGRFIPSYLKTRKMMRLAPWPASASSPSCSAPSRSCSSCRTRRDAAHARAVSSNTRLGNAAFALFSCHSPAKRTTGRPRMFRAAMPHLLAVVGRQFQRRPVFAGEFQRAN